MKENRTITLSELDLDITYSVKDNSPRGCHTVSGYNLKLGDKIVIDNYFHEIIEEPAEEIKTEEIENEENEMENKIRTAEEITAEIIAYFEENEDIFNDCITELDSYNGYLGDDRYYEMEMLDNFYRDCEPSELLRRAFYGYDLDNWTTDAHGNRENAAFNPNRDYFRYNGYGNLVSTNYPDYSDKLDNYAIEEMTENRVYIDSIDHDETLTALFDELEALEESDE